MNNTGSVIQVYKRLLRYVSQFWLIFLIALIGNVVYSAVDAFFVYFLKPALDQGFIGRDPIFLRWLPVLIFCVFVLRAVSSEISTYCMEFVSRHVIMRLRQELFTHFQKLPATFYDHTTSGALLSQLIYNVEQVANASANAITMSIQSTALIIGLLVVMFVISWQITLLYFLTIPLIMLVMRITNQRARCIGRALQKSMADTTTAAEENIEGYKEVRAFNGAAFERKRFFSCVNRNRQLEMKNVIIKAIASSSVQMLAGTALTLTLYLATSGILGSILSAGDFVALIGAMLAILKPFKNYTSVNNAIQRGVVGAQGVFSLLDETVEDDSGTQSPAVVRGDVDMHQVNFTYPLGGKRVLSDITLSVKQGQVVALVGKSGGGKSTLVSLLPRFYHDYTGEIKIDGVDIRKYRLEALRHQFALVSQQVVLFNDTIFNNIAYGESNTVNKEAVYKAARLAHADEFIQGLSKGYETLIGDNGVLLSGGQRQRIAIARALYKNAPILILDEATSALDTASERHIQAGLESLMRGRTTFVIAHRLSTIEHADVIVVMEQGKIIEQGSHAQLLAQGGAYAKLHAMQFSDS